MKPLEYDCGLIVSVLVGQKTTAANTSRGVRVAPIGTTRTVELSNKPAVRRAGSDPD